MYWSRQCGKVLEKFVQALGGNRRDTVLNTAGIPLSLGGVKAEDIGKESQNIFMAVHNFNGHLVSGHCQGHSTPKSVV